MADVKVIADQTTDLGQISWKPIAHGETIWQIGVPDRSSAEFHGGDDVRHYDNFIRYVHDFPNDVAFTVGKSQESKDWNFAQFGWYAKNPYWSILFDRPEAMHGTGTLSLAFAAWDYPHAMTVTLNGEQIGSFKLAKSGPAIYRSGGQDSLRQNVYLPFDASLIRSGKNEIRLALEDEIPFADPDSHTAVEIGGVAYDAIRLEVDQGAKYSPPSSMKND